MQLDRLNFIPKLYLNKGYRFNVLKDKSSDHLDIRHLGIIFSASLPNYFVHDNVVTTLDDEET